MTVDQCDVKLYEVHVHMGIQGNLEGKSSNLPEATSGLFFQAPLQLS